MSTAERNRSVISDSYNGGCPHSAICPAIVDQRFDDFDAQSEQLSGHDQEYAQLSAGKFSGRFVSAFAGTGVSIHCEKASQALEQWIGCPSDLVSIGLVLEESSGFVVNGSPLGIGDILITRPGGEMNLCSPANGAIMAICVDRNLLADGIGDGSANSLFSERRADVETFHSPILARHLRSDALQVMRSLKETSLPAQAEDLASRFVSALSAQMSLHAALADSGHSAASTRRTDFLRAKKLIAGAPMEQIDYDWLCRRTNWSKRSIQAAFAEYARTSPSKYLRMVKLNRARRALLDASNSEDSIGDIAAASGFWNWSRFTEDYKALFCELPSETRARAAQHAH